MSEPKRIVSPLAGGLPGETPEQWFVRMFGKPPPPTNDMDVPEDASFEHRRRDAMAVLARTIPPLFRWSRFAAPELTSRVSPSSAVDEGQAACDRARACLVGQARAGKTSLAVAMLRRRVWKTGIPAMFFPAHRLGMARLQHPAGHGEPETVEQAIRMPLALIDDLGSELDMAMNAIPQVIFDRHAACRDTWITTGMTREQLVTRYGQGTVARLFEGATVIRLGAGGS